MRYDDSVSELVRATSDGWSFDLDAMIAAGKAHRHAYATAQPWPYVILDGVLGDVRSSTIARAYPPASHPGWKRRDYAEQSGRMGQLQRTAYDGVASEVRWMLAELNGMGFIGFLGALTDRRDLIPDPAFTGAGLMATVPGGHLGVHVDFNRDSARHLDRVVSILYYVPTTWDPAWGGELELWDRTRSRCVTCIAPLRDRLVVLAYGEDHWHGHPTPLACPDTEMRAVVAAHYYAARAQPGDDDNAHGAVW